MASSLPEKSDWSAPASPEDHNVCSTDVPAGSKASCKETRLPGDERHIPSSEVLEAIENVIEGVFKSLAQNKAPVLTVARRSDWRNVEFTDSVGLQMVPHCTMKQIRSDCPRSASRFALMLKILSMIYKMVQSNTYATKRDIYYTDTQLFGSQLIVDNIITDISCMLKIPRRSLHILSTVNGFVAGNLSYTEEDGTKVNCTCGATAVTVPSNVQGIKNLISHAKFMLIVEKDATFQRLLDDDFCNRMSPCIMITGKGVPDLNTRLFVRKLWDSFQIPIFTLMDADPHGVEIMCIYKYGSVIKYTQRCPDSIYKARSKKLASLQKRPYIACQPMWKKELEIMAASKLKAEIQVLTSLSSHYLSRVYLPNKLQFGGWI